MNYSQIKALVVDDMAGMRRFVTSKLQEIGIIESYQAENGVEALKLLEEDRGINLIISDINMPEMDGIELLKRVRETEETKDIYFITITAELELQTVSKVVQLGTNDYILKPFDTNQLKEKIDKMPSLEEVSLELSKEDLLNLFLDHVQGAIGKSCQATVEKCSDGPEKDYAGQVYYSVCHYECRGHKGTLGLEFFEEDYLNYLSAMYGEEFSIVDEDLVDVVSELLNIALGQIRNTLNQKYGDGYNFTIPMTVEGTNINFGENEKVESQHLKSTNGCFDMFLIEGDSLIVPWKNS